MGEIGYSRPMNDPGLIETARLLSKSLTPGDLDHTLSRITAAAVEVLDEVDYASITVKHSDGRLETVGPTDDVLRGVDAAQYELQEGPCYEAAVDSVHVLAPDLATDERFPRYAASAVAVGIRAQAGLRLFDAPRSEGALNLYSTTVGRFEDLGSIGQLFAHQSAVAIGYAHEIENLQEAMKTRRTIGQAIGIVMERYTLTDQRAFAFLARLSQHGNVKLRRLSEELVADAERKGEQGINRG
jgi:GAF domain-containing protein